MDSAPLHSSKPSAAVSRVPSPSPDPLVPPYWQHRRYESYASISTSRRAPIVLEDRTTGANDGDGAQQCATGALWAKAVSLDGYVVVKGNLPAAGGEYIVWNCTIETLAGGSIIILKRYSEFRDLRRKLTIMFPDAGVAMPRLPPKSVMQRFRPEFLEKRRAGLAYFMNCILLNPQFSSAPVLKEFILA